MGHRHSRESDRKRLGAVLAIGSFVLLLELAAGVATNSLALLADAGHAFADVSGVALALGAMSLASRPASPGRTFGWYRAEILAAAFNAVILLGVAAFVLYEAWRRLYDAPDIASGPMLVVALVALGANLFAARLLHGAQRSSLNMRAAYLEVLTDAASSGAVVLAATVIALTGFRAADAIASALIALLILPRSWVLLREAVDILLEASPKGMDMAHVRQHILDAPGVRDVHDLHAWTITSGMPVLSAHVVLEEAAPSAPALDSLSRCLADHFDVEHSTFQLETPDRRHLETPHS